MARVISIAIFLFAAVRFGTAAAEDHGLLERCWTPQALTGTQAEIKVRAHTKLDLATLKQEKLPDASPVPPELRGSIRSVELPFGEKLVALTFDLCETDGAVAGYDGRVIDLLRAQSSPAANGWRRMRNGRRN